MTVYRRTTQIRARSASDGSADPALALGARMSVGWTENPFSVLREMREGIPTENGCEKGFSYQPSMVN
jgi:hypothetical protein